MFTRYSDLESFDHFRITLQYTRGGGDQHAPCDSRASFAKLREQAKRQAARRDETSPGSKSCDAEVPTPKSRTHVRWVHFERGKGTIAGESLDMTGHSHSRKHNKPTIVD